MKFDFQLPAVHNSKTPPQQLQGNYFVVIKADGPFQIQFGNELPIELQRNETVYLGPNPSVQLQNARLKNLAGVDNDIVLFASTLQVTKKISTEISETVNLADNQQVGIDPNLNAVQVANAVQIAGGQSVGVSSLPAVQIDAGQSVEVSSLPAVQIDHGAIARVPSVTNAGVGTGAGTVAAGARYIRFYSAVGDYTVDGQTIPGGQSFDLPLLPKGETYNAVNYEAPAADSDLIITEVR